MPFISRPSACIGQLEGPAPGMTAIGRGSVAVVRGWVATEPGRPVRGYVLHVGDRITRHAPSREMRTVPMATAYRYLAEGFWLPLTLTQDAIGATVEIALDIELHDGRTQRIGERTLHVVDEAQHAALPSARVVVCLCSYNPDPELLRVQIESLRAQTLTDWICLVEDDASQPDRLRDLERVCSEDARFVLVRNETNVGFYRNFERCLRRVPKSAEYVALCDQDDRWYPDKLESGLAAFTDPEVQLVYSDMRIIDRDGRVLADTYWTSRRNSYESFETLLVANTVTGAASIMRRSLLDGALPFPENPGSAFHDHWLACVAMAAGRIAYVDRPLYGYTQHGTSVIGHCGFQALTLKQALVEHVRTIARLMTQPGRARSRISGMLGLHHFEYRKLALYRDTLLLRYPHMTSARRAALELFGSRVSDAVRLMTLEHLGVHRRGDTTNLAEFQLGASLALHRYLEPLLAAQQHRQHVAQRALAALRGIAHRLKDAVVHDGEAQEAMARMHKKLVPVSAVVDSTQPVRVNLLVPEIDFDHFFGGYIGKLQLAQRLAERGFSVRVILVDKCELRIDKWRAQLQSYSGLEHFFDRVEVVSAWPRHRAVHFSPGDRVIATTWWTAHLGHAVTQRLLHEELVYLIQEHEPFTFPMGAWYAMAAASYALSHCAIFSTELLADYFRGQHLGVFSRPGGELQQLAFRNAITPQKPAWARIEARKTRRLLFYCRPEAHAARNMYEVGISALARAIELGAFDDGEWELNGIGSSEGGWIELPRGKRLRMVQRLGLADYAQLLGEHDVGLSLMYTPHPSLVLLEMAAAGLLVVTNTCLNKTAASLSEISTNLLACEATIDAIAQTLVTATRAASDFDRRRAGAIVDWPTSWDTALSPAIMTTIEGWLRSPVALAAGDAPRRRERTIDHAS